MFFKNAPLGTMESTEKALVLKVGRFREVDAWVRLFSPHKGLFTAFAFGGCVSRKRFCGCLDPFNLVQFKVKTQRSGGYTYLLEGALINAHRRLRQDNERLGMAVNCLKFLEAAHLGHTGSQAAYALLLGALAALEETPEPSRLLPLFFRGRMAFDQGLAPQWRHCSGCGADTIQTGQTGQTIQTGQPGQTGPTGQGGGARFVVEEGRVLCPACRFEGRGTVLPLGRESLSILAAVECSPPSEWALLTPGTQARMECGRALDLFVRYHLGLTWEHGSFTRI